MLDDLDAAARVVYAAMPATPQQRWPLLDARCGTAVWVKHENQTPVGAFKVRGGLVYFDHLRSADSNVRGVVAATRGNHGQSVAFAARRYAIPAAVVVPRGNCRQRTAPCVRWGRSSSRVVTIFRTHSRPRRRLPPIAAGTWCRPSTCSWFAASRSYALELFRAAPGVDVLYVPIGLGSGICGAIAARDAIGLATKIVGVVSSAAPAYARSLELGHAVSHDASSGSQTGWRAAHQCQRRCR